MIVKDFELPGIILECIYNKEAKQTTNIQILSRYCLSERGGDGL
jgi:hypothetical protein